MKNIMAIIATLCVVFTSLTLSRVALADDSYAETVANFKQAKDTHKFFDNAYGYAIFPTIAKGGFGIGAAYGRGRVYKGNNYRGDTSLTQISIGFQLGGQAYSEIIFFKNARAYDEFTKGSFEFGAQASAVAITIGAYAQAGTTGNSSSAGKSAAKAFYINDMAVYTLAKGGLMYEAALAGQTFTFEEK